MPNDPYHVFQYPLSRQLTMDLGKIGREKHHIKALLEVDVTEARVRIKEHRRAGKKIAFTAWLIKVVSDCAALHPPVCGYNQPSRNRVVAFEDVDTCIVVEREVDGTPVPLPYVIRAANRKTLDQIHLEIEAARTQEIEDEGNFVLGPKINPLAMRLFTRLPSGLRLALMRTFYFNNPQRMKNTQGTVMVTTVGMVGHTTGWMIPFSMHPLCVAVGSLNEQPAAYRGEIRKREILHVTLLIDHDVIDGMPSARFVDDLVKKMQEGWGL